MKIYNKIKIDIDTGEVLEEDSFNYTGPVALCGGGSSKTVTFDKEFNRRMADIADAELGMAREKHQFWKEVGAPWERAMADTNMRLLPQYESTTRAQMIADEKLAGMSVTDKEMDLKIKDADVTEAQYKKTYYERAMDKDEFGTSLLELRQDEERARLTASMELLPHEVSARTEYLKYSQQKAAAAGQLLPQQTAVASSMYNEALRGFDVDAAGRRASSDVAQAYSGAEGSLRREMSRTGQGFNEAQYASHVSGMHMDRARSMAGHMTLARSQERDKGFAAKQAAVATNIGGMGVPDPGRVF